MRNFEETLENIKNSAEQLSYQTKVQKYHYLSCSLFLIFALILVVAIIILFSSLNKNILWIIIPISILTILISEKYHVKSINTAKEQNRRYFLHCLREAESIDELNKVGLFAYYKQDDGDKWTQDVKLSINKFKSALSKSPNWLNEDNR